MSERVDVWKQPAEAGMATAERAGSAILTGSVKRS